MGTTASLRSNANVFDPHAVAVLGSAFDEAWESLQRDNLAPDAGSEAVRDIVAKAIVQVALLGERDRLRLRDAALRHLATRGG